MKTTTKTASVKGLLMLGMLLNVTACGTVSTPLSYHSIHSITKPFALRTHDMQLQQRQCTNSYLLMQDCDAVVRRDFRLRDNVRENVFDNLSDRLFANGRSNGKARWRLKRDRVEWQYRF
ncbi:hypothetical protein HMY34_01060 [Thiothrix subterranea]|uniref:hypothetical protein n=1 Tax=Thiothrix subterranea TaxID=2735563 RepID=UPI00192B0031|nr:hypothetical protein [Thiothrix subterranea]QQZ27458.1 hypothetical protein HMY34_01060 [Thiothrix subterranea]